MNIFWDRTLFYTAFCTKIIVIQDSWGVGGGRDILAIKDNFRSWWKVKVWRRIFVAYFSSGHSKTAWPTSIGDWWRNALPSSSNHLWPVHNLVTSSCVVISTDQSHTSEVAAILKYLYGNSLPNENVANLILTRLYVPCPVSTWPFTNLTLLLQKHPGDVGASLFLLLPPLIIRSRFMEAWPHGAHQDRQVCLQHF